MTATSSAGYGFINAADPSSPLDVRPVTGRIGAEIVGLDLSSQVDDATASAIKQALWRHKVIFFRNQQLDDFQQEAFAKRIGKPRLGFVPADKNAPEEDRQNSSSPVLELNASEGYLAKVWHTDQTSMLAPPDMTMLRSVVVPEAGGDTLWANSAAAYHFLPDALKTLVDDLWAVHVGTTNYNETFGRNQADLGGGKQQNFQSGSLSALHPVVRIHPETGERALMVGSYNVDRFVGLNRDDSHHLVSVLQDHITLPENTLRWRWRVGDVVIWDNRSTQHRAIDDFGKQARVMRRITFDGSIPVGVDGRTSKELAPVAA